jgi:hypothetical protein
MTRNISKLLNHQEKQKMRKIRRKKYIHIQSHKDTKFVKVAQVAQAVKQLPSKHEALRLNPCATKNKNKRQQRDTNYRFIIRNVRKKLLNPNETTDLCGLLTCLTSIQFCQCGSCEKKHLMFPLQTECHRKDWNRAGGFCKFSFLVNCHSCMSLGVC